MKVVMQKGEMLRVELTNGSSMLISDDGKTSTMPTEWEQYANERVSEELTQRERLLESARHLREVNLPYQEKQELMTVRETPVTLTEAGERHFGTVKPPTG